MPMCMMYQKRDVMLCLWQRTQCNGQRRFVLRWRNWNSFLFSAPGCPKERSFLEGFFLEGFQPKRFALLARGTRRWRSVSSISGKIMTGEDRSAARKTCPNLASSTTNLTWTDLGSYPGLGGGRPTTDRLSHRSVRTTKLCLNYI